MSGIPGQPPKANGHNRPAPLKISSPTPIQTSNKNNSAFLTLSLPTDSLTDGTSIPPPPPSPPRSASPPLPDTPNPLKAHPPLEFLRSKSRGEDSIDGALEVARSRSRSGSPVLDDAAFSSLNRRKTPTTADGVQSYRAFHTASPVPTEVSTVSGNSVGRSSPATSARKNSHGQASATNKRRSSSFLRLLGIRSFSAANPSQQGQSSISPSPLSSRDPNAQFRPTTPSTVNSFATDATGNRTLRRKSSFGWFSRKSTDALNNVSEMAAGGRRGDDAAMDTDDDENSRRPVTPPPMIPEVGSRRSAKGTSSELVDMGAEDMFKGIGR